MYIYIYVYKYTYIYIYIYIYKFQREYCAACEATPPQCPVHVPYRIGPTVTVRSGRAPNPTTKGVLPGFRAQGPGTAHPPRKQRIRDMSKVT